MNVYSVGLISWKDNLAFAENTRMGSHSAHGTELPTHHKAKMQTLPHSGSQNPLWFFVNPA